MLLASAEYTPGKLTDITHAQDRTPQELPGLGRELCQGWEILIYSTVWAPPLAFFKT